jgi:hypothetical protein
MNRPIQYDILDMLQYLKPIKNAIELAPLPEKEKRKLKRAYGALEAHLINLIK